MNPVIAILGQLYPLTEETTQLFQKILKQKFARKGELLVRIGQVPDKFYFIEKGLARVYYKRNDLDVTDYFAIDNQFIGALPALF